MRRVVIIGGGAAGFFAAITAAEANPELAVTICEASRQVLAKVRISGGGRCNCTHHCFDPRELVTQYPRGSRELLGPFNRFGPADTIAWFEGRGVPLKVEDDGRMFPVSDDSASIVDCLTSSAEAAGVRVLLGSGIQRIEHANGLFTLSLASGTLAAEAVVLASGSSPRGHALAAALGHTIIDPVPSLFTFDCDAPWLTSLAGISRERATVMLAVNDEHISATGPVLITHRGLSGPAVLRVSAFGARLLHAVNYQCSITIDWLAGGDADALIANARDQYGQRKLRTTPLAGIAKRLWEALLARAGINAERSWSQLRRDEASALAAQLARCTIPVRGKSTFKEEFVTAGGVARDELNWRSMASKTCPGLYVVGEAVDVDAVTGGFNFQHAWTSGYLAGSAIAAS